MVAKNDITGDTITSKAATDAFREGWERIFKQREDGDILIERDYDGGYLISVAGNRNLIRLTKRQYDNLVKTVLTHVTAEQIAEALKESE